MNSFDQSFDSIDRTLSRLSSRRGLCSCEPVTIGVGAMAGAGAISSIAGQNTTRQMNKHYEDQKANAQDQVIIENRMRATKDYLRTVRLTQLEQTQETEALAEQSQDISREVDAAQGTAMVSAADRGVGGNNLDMILSDYAFQQDQEVGRLRMNQAMKDQQHGEAIAGMRDTFDYRVAAEKPYQPRVQAPVDYFGPIFSAAGTTLNAAGPMFKEGGLLSGKRGPTKAEAEAGTWKP